MSTYHSAHIYPLSHLLYIDGYKKEGYVREGDVLTLVQLVAAIKSDGTKDNTWIDDLIAFLAPGSTFADFITKGNLMDANILADIVTNTDTTSQASKEWTVTAAKKWIVLAVAISNDTSTFIPTLYVTPVGGSATKLSKVTAWAATRLAQLIGAGIYGVGSHPLVLDAGDKIKVEDGSFTASDVMAMVIMYVEVTA